LDACEQGWTAAICLKLHLEIAAQTGNIVGLTCKHN